MAENDKEELALPVDPVDRAALEIEARDRGVSIEAVASERFSDALQQRIDRIAAFFSGSNRPSRGPLN